MTGFQEVSNDVMLEVLDTLKTKFNFKKNELKKIKYKNTNCGVKYFVDRYEIFGQVVFGNEYIVVNVRTNTLNTGSNIQSKYKYATVEDFNLMDKRTYKRNLKRFLVFFFLQLLLMTYVPEWRGKMILGRNIRLKETDMEWLCEDIEQIGCRWYLHYELIILYPYSIHSEKSNYFLRKFSTKTFYRAMREESILKFDVV